MILKWARNDNLADAAVQLAGNFGWHVLPCWGITEDRQMRLWKVRLLKPRKTPSASTRSTRPAQRHGQRGDHHRLVEEFPKANVGVRTGAESDLVVVDLDGKQGIDAFEKYADGRILPMTPVAVTGRGQHYYFRYPADSEVKNRTRIAGKPIDIRAANGYVIAPPSAHITGTQYQWLKSPHDVSIAQPPGWLLELVMSGNGAAHLMMERSSLTAHWPPTQVRTKGAAMTLCAVWLANTSRSTGRQRTVTACPGLGRAMLTGLSGRTGSTNGARYRREACCPASSTSHGSAILTPYNTIEPQEVEWLWPGRIAMGS